MPRWAAWWVSSHRTRIVWAGTENRPSNIYALTPTMEMTYAQTGRELAATGNSSKWWMPGTDMLHWNLLTATNSWILITRITSATPTAEIRSTANLKNFNGKTMAMGQFRSGMSERGNTFALTPGTVRIIRRNVTRTGMPSARTAMEYRGKSFTVRYR